MNRKLTIAICGGALAATVVGGASGALERPSGSLAIDATFRIYWRVDRSFCPPGTPSSADCLQAVGVAVVPGLGRATVTHRKILPGNDENCFMVQDNNVPVEVANKGALELVRPGRICVGPPPRVDGPYAFAVAGGSGKYAQATGSLSEKTSVYAGDAACRCGTAIDTWKGTLTVPGLDFDTTAPIIAGAVSKIARAPKGAKRMRVRYVVTAKDEVDGPVSATCRPRSGSFFKRGRTKVSCSAIDSSGNTAKASFRITVK